MIEYEEDRTLVGVNIEEADGASPGDMCVFRHYCDK